MSLSISAPSRIYPGGGDMTQAVYDPEADGRVEGAETVTDGANVSAAAEVRNILSLPFRIPLLASPITAPGDMGTWSGGQYLLDTAILPAGRSLRLVAVGRTSDIALTGTIVLWDLQASEAASPVMSFVGTLDFQTQTVALTIGVGAGKIKAGSRLYEVQVTAGGVLPINFMQAANVFIESYL